MKKRILSILLCLCMVACMLPTVAFAADTGKAIRLVNTNNPTGGILGYKNNNNSYDYIYMGSYNSSPVKWRVLDDQTNTGATGLFLLSEDLLGSGGHGDVYDVYSMAQARIATHGKAATRRVGAIPLKAAISIAGNLLQFCQQRKATKHLRAAHITLPLLLLPIF